jgi:hypothetical protein
VRENILLCENIVNLHYAIPETVTLAVFTGVESIIVLDSADAHDNPIVGLARRSSNVISRLKSEASAFNRTGEEDNDDAD